MKSISLISKFLTACILGTTITALWLQFDDRFLDIAHDQVVIFFKEKYNARFCAEKCYIKPFSLAIKFENVHVDSFDSADKWSWSADSFVLKCNFLSYFVSRKISLSILLNRIRAFTVLQSGVKSLVDHVKTILSDQKGEGVIFLKNISLQDIHIEYSNDKNKVNGFIAGYLAGEKVNDQFITNIIIKDGSSCKGDIDYLVDLKGNLVITSFLNEQSKDPYVTFDCSCTSPQFPDDIRYIFYSKGSWDGHHGSCIMHTQDHSVLIHPCTLTKENNEYVYTAKLFIECDLLRRLLMPKVKESLEGSCEVSIEGSSCGVLKAVSKINQISYKGFMCENIVISAEKDLKDIQGTMLVDFNDVSLDGSFSYSLEKKQGNFSLTNSSIIPLYGYWQFPIERVNISGDFSTGSENYIEYNAQIFHTKTEENVFLNGSLHHKDNSITIRGCLGSHLYSIDATTDPFIINSALYTDKDGNELISCSFSDVSHFKAFMNYETVRSFAHSWYDSFLPGKGLCAIYGVFDRNGVTGKFDISDALIRLPGMYNFIEKGSLNYDYNMHNNILLCNDVVFDLHKGKMVSKRIKIQFPGDKRNLFCHVPLNFYHCFLNTHKQLYCTLTGSLLYFHKNNSSKITGFCYVEDMNIKDNIFASELYNSWGRDAFSSSNNNFLSTTQLSIDVSTQQPAVITTPVLKTDAQFKCLIKGSFEDPSFEGKLYLQGGKIIFPAHDLSITRGKITFLSGQNSDHLLDVVAEGRIKKYLINLMIGGSLQDPTIRFQSSPSLTQEQIMVLLFGGIEEQSLNIMAPALVMYNAKNFLFSESSQYEAIKNTLVPAWLQPFQRVNFIPRFTDQTGRGGLKGVLEVEVNDRLRGAIEKNFSLSENAAAEVEYLLSDDVSLKVSKDDRGDVGAEMEMRFKF